MSLQFLFFGHPYDPTSDAFFDELPSGIKITGISKKTLKRNYSDIDLDDFLHIAHEGFMRFSEDNFDSMIFNFIDCFITDNHHNIRKSKLENIYSIAKKKGPKYLNRLALSYIPPYEIEIQEHFESTGSKRNLKWTDCLTDRSLSVKDIVESNFDAILSRPNEYEDLSEKEKDIFNMIALFFHRDPLPNHSMSELIDIITMFRAKKTRQNALIKAWSLARSIDIVEIFFSFYAFYKDDIDLSLHPFLNQELLEIFSGTLVNRGQEELDFFSEIKSSISFSRVEGYVENESKIDAILKSRAYLKNDDNFPEISSLISYLQGAIDHNLSDPDSFFTEEISHLIEGIPRLSTNDEVITIDKISVLTQHIDDFFTKSYFSGKITGFSIKARRELKTSLESLEKEAHDLGKSPLSNMKRLQQISDKFNELNEEKNKGDAIVIKIYSETIEKFNKAIIEFNKPESGEIKEITPPSINKVKDKCADLVLENETLGLEVLSIKEELHDAKEKLYQKEQCLNQMKNGGSTKTDSVITLDDVHEIMINPTVSSAVKMVQSVNKTIELSSKAKSSMDSLTEFKRHDMLIHKLGILSSPEFLKTFSEQGSQACFTLLTNNELSFREPKSIKAKQIRHIKFDDGVTRDCKSHLKICSTTHEQYMLRIFFTIEDGRVYIGNISKWMDCDA